MLSLVILVFDNLYLITWLKLLTEKTYLKNVKFFFTNDTSFIEGYSSAVIEG